MSDHKICLYAQIWKIIAKLSLFMLLIWSAAAGCIVKPNCSIFRTLKVNILGVPISRTFMVDFVFLSILFICLSVQTNG